MPIYGFVRYVANGDGTFRPLVRTWHEYVKLTEDTPARLGLANIDYRVISRLGMAGFVKVLKITPNNTLVNVKSLMDHIEAAHDPEFWDEKKIRRYRAASMEIREIR